MRIDHPSLDVLYAKVRRERAEAIYRLVIVPVVRFFRKKGGRPAARTAPLRSRLA